MNNNLTLCMAYLDKLPTAQSGAGGHNATLQAALAIRRFELDGAEAWEAMSWYNHNRCSPEWSEKELRHKLASVANLPIKKKLGQGRGMPHRVRAFVAPEPPRVPEPDTRPVIERSEQEEETWWAQWCAAHGTTLEEFDAMVGNA